jgi:hypothetical protein
MNDKLKRKQLNDAFKRFQRLPILSPKGDMRVSGTEKPAWQPFRLGLAAQCVHASPNSALQALAE